MLKLVKYEVRRNRNWMMLVLLAAIGLQGYFLIASQIKNEEHMMISGALLVWATLIVILGLLITGVSIYSRELSAKSSYLTFMTPNSAYKILGAKVLTIFVLGIGFAALLLGFAAWDFRILSRIYPRLNLVYLFSEFNLGQAGIDMTVSQVLWMIAQFAIASVVSFFTVIMIAYLAITLSATVLQNKKFKGIITMLLFIGILFGMQWVIGKIPTTNTYASIQDVLKSLTPRFIVELAIMVAAFFTSGWLLENKVSL